MSKLPDIAAAVRRLSHPRVSAAGAFPVPGGDEVREPAHRSSPDAVTQSRARADVDSESRVSPQYRRTGRQAGVFIGGQRFARWRNPFVDAAMPAILRLQRHLDDGTLQAASVRSQLALEVRLFRESLAQARGDSEQSNDASYLLCTYLDEAVSDAARQGGKEPYGGDLSLLVEFHDDAWGGEDAFVDLERWMSHDPPPQVLLVLYELILSLGWQGRYRIRERGGVLLQDLRSQLRALLGPHDGPEALGAVLAPAQRASASRWTAGRVLVGAILLCALGYTVATLGLNAQGRPLREALAAWTPPTRTINLAETLPSPLPELLAEGWMSAYKHPQGWLLVFRSDGAFDTGADHVRPDFVHNIRRLGAALAPWPGDLEVIGHTDSQPIRSRQFNSNQALSQARAQTFSQLLKQSAAQGGSLAAPSALARVIESSGRGDSEPVDTADTAQAFRRNRRVEVLWKVLPQGRNQTGRMERTFEPRSQAGGLSPQFETPKPRDGQQP